MIVPLFGGAITCELPDDVVDVSDFRPVPDNQEVFLIENGATEIEKKSVFIELLESPQGSVNDVFKTHLSDILDVEVADIDRELAQQGASEVAVVSQFDNKMGPDNYLVVFKHETKGTVAIQALLRVNKVQTDILVTMFIDLDNNKYSELKGIKAAELVGGVLKEDMASVQRIGSSMDVVDWGLFA